MTPSTKEYPKYRVARHSVEQPEDPSIRLIPLTQGQVAIVDVGDFAALDRWNWSAHWNPCTKSFTLSGLHAGLRAVSAFICTGKSWAWRMEIPAK
jgi:hypothetical protein